MRKLLSPGSLDSLSGGKSALPDLKLVFKKRKAKSKLWQRKSPMKFIGLFYSSNCLYTTLRQAQDDIRLRLKIYFTSSKSILRLRSGQATLPLQNQHPPHRCFRRYLLEHQLQHQVREHRSVGLPAVPSTFPQKLPSTLHWFYPMQAEWFLLLWFRRLTSSLPKPLR